MLTQIVRTGRLAGFLLLLNSPLLTAQNPGAAVFTGCGSDAVLQRDSFALREQHLLDSMATAWFSHPSHSHNSTSSISYIPVVVHIIHNNGPENISDAQVQTAIANINAKYAGGVNQIQFCLAQRDPQGNATTGITRDISPLTTMDMDLDDIALKNINRWPPTCYMNIWIVRDINSIYIGNAVVGYSRFPSSAGTPTDGNVIEAGFFGVDPQSDAVGAHEIGHYLGLYHTFQNGCLNNNCLTDGDMVCDTPPDQSTFASCVPPSNSCSTDADDPGSNNPFTTDVPDLSEDYMDYSAFSCYNQFTPGQYARMQYFLNGARASLLQCLSCTPPCPNPVTASITSPATTYYVTTGSTVNFTGTASNPGVQWYIDPANIFSTSTGASYTFSTDGHFWIKFVSLSTDPTQCLNGIDSVEIIVTSPVVNSCTGSLDFQDASPAVALPNSNQYYTGTNGGYTWECWFKLDQLPTGTLARPLISSIDAVTYEDMYLGFGWDGGVQDAPVNTLVFKVDGPGAFPIDPNCTYTPPGGFVTGVWYHAAGVADYTTQTKKLFLNGVLVDTEIISYSPITRSIESQLSFDYVAPWSTGPRPLHGKMDEVRVWTVPKTDAEILANYSTCVSANSPNLLLYYHCNQSAGSSVVDATANGFTGTFTQSSGWSLENAPISGTACVASCIEICDNGIDDNANGLIDEGCACPTINAGADTTICSGAQVQLQADTAFTSYSWAPAAGLDNPSVSNPVASPASTTDYTLTATIPGPNLVVNPDFSAGNFGFTSGQIYSSVYTPCNYEVTTAYFIYSGPPFFDHTPGNDNMFMSIDGCTSGPTMIWQETIPVILPGTNYTFSFWATEAGAVQPTFEIHFIGNVTGDIILNTIPGIPAVGNNWVWDQYGIASWNSGSNTSVTIKIVNLQTNGFGNDFALDDFSFGRLCTATDTVRVTVITNPAPILNIGPDIQLCESGTHTFDAGTGHLLYHWSDGSDLQQFTAHEPGTYWVTVTDSCGGTQTDTVHIIATPAPIITLPADTAFCIQANMPMTYTSGSTFTNFLWSPAAGLSCDTCANPVCTATVTTMYYLVATTAEGCGAMDSMNVVVVVLPPPSLDLGPDIQLCPSAIQVLDAGVHVTYLWQDGSTGQNFAAPDSGTYWVTVTDSCGSPQTDTVHITLLPANAYTLSNDTNLCAGESTLLTFSGTSFSSVLWSPAGSLSCSNCVSTTAVPIVTTTYTVTAITAQNCMVTDSVHIGVLPVPSSISTSQSCDSIGKVFLGAVTGGVPPYQFDFNNTGFSTATSYTVGVTTNYPLIVKDNNGCLLDTTVHLVAYLTPLTTISYTTLDIKCLSNGSLVIHGVNGGMPPYNYNFNSAGFSGDTVYNGLNAGTYTLTVQDSMNCLLDVPIVIAVDYAAPASVDLFTTFFTCDSGGTVSVLNVSGGAAPYLFSINNGAYSGTGYYNELTAGFYSLSVKDSNSCVLDTSFSIYEFFDYEVVYVPNCFTPNHDVFNDTWSVRGSCVEAIDCRIYNRWGEEIAHLTDINDSWDGTYKKQLVENGVYMYVLDIRYYSQNSERRSGAINVLR